MEVDEIQTQACKFSRIRSDSNKIGQKGEDEDEVELKRIASAGGGNDIGRFCGWPSSRIVRVSRASGGKDRHSKVWTSRGLRDRRVRLSVTTAIQFYDLQDRLGCDQPSKAVEWLLKAAASSIAELPSLNTSFPDTPKQLSDEKRSSGATTEIGFDSTNHLELDIDPNFRQQQQQQNVSLSKSACSSTSETSKGSGGLSLSRSESRIKARERARGRAAEKEKEKETESLFAGHRQNVTSIPQNSSFTELLTSNINNANNNNSTGHKSSRQWPSTPMDYFASGLNHSSAGFSGQIHLGNSLSHSMMVSPFSVTPGDHHQELQQFSFVPNNLVPVATATGGSDYNLNFSISSGLAGFNRGTLQSNSPSLLPHLQRFSPIDGSNSPFFLGSTAPNAENHHQHHQFPTGFDSRLQLDYGEAGRHSDQKGKAKH